jgi:hypothetical protein
LEASKESHLQSIAVSNSLGLLFIQLQQARQQVESLIASVENLQKENRRLRDIIRMTVVFEKKEIRRGQEIMIMTVVFAFVAIVTCYLARDIFSFIFP